MRESAGATCCLVWWLVDYYQGFLSIAAASYCARLVPWPSDDVVDHAVLFGSQDGKEG